jgi:hypothetical protein
MGGKRILDGAVDEKGERRCFLVGQFHAWRVRV